LNIYAEEIDIFPYSIYNETNIIIKNYIKELIFVVQEISNNIHYNKNIAIALLLLDKYKILKYF
jgi:hypothetical protein